MIKNKLASGEYAELLSYIYCTSAQESQTQAARYIRAIEAFRHLFGDEESIQLFSAPGRTELCGNHTDHQNGHVLAASVNMDMIAVARPNEEGIISIKSEGYAMNNVNLKSLSPLEEEKNTTLSLIRGITSSFIDMGYPVKGFDAYITSNVLKGSGLSSSAAFETLVGTIINGLFCNGEVNAVKIAQIGQYAENHYFGKPSGLMDQMASSVGGFVTIDFKDIKNPIVEQIDFDFINCEHTLCIIDTGGNHADLTPDYASIPHEMHSIADYFGKEFLSDVPEENIYKNMETLRKKCGDRALLRAIHFYDDDKRVAKEVTALKNNDFETFKQLVVESGYSSYMYLQNVYSNLNSQEQGLSLALCICEKLLKGKGAYRVHGGGFAGTVQAFVPNEFLAQFKIEIEAIFGQNKCHILSIRPVGGIELKQ